MDRTTPTTTPTSTPVPASDPFAVNPLELRNNIRVQLADLNRLPDDILDMPQDVNDVLVARAEGKLSHDAFLVDERVLEWRAHVNAARAANEADGPAWAAIGERLADLIDVDPCRETLEVAREWVRLMPRTPVLPTTRTIRALNDLLEAVGLNDLLALAGRTTS